MRSDGGILNALILNLQSQSDDANAFLVALKHVVKEMGLTVSWGSIDRQDEISIHNVKNYEQSLGFILYPVQATNYSQLSKSIYPVLIQLEGSENFYVLTQDMRAKNCLFNSSENKPEAYTNVKIIRAWQCGAIHFPVVASFVELIKLVITRFRKEVSKAIVLGAVASLSTLLLGMMSSYILRHQHELSLSGCLTIFISFLMVVISAAIFAWMNEICNKAVNTKLVYLSLPSLFSHLLSLSLKKSKKYISTDVSQRLSDYETALSQVMTASLSICMNGITLILLFFYFMYSSVLLASLYCIICIILMIIKSFLLPSNIKYILAQQVEQSKQASLLNEIFLQIQKVRSAHAEKSVFNQWLLGLLQVKLQAERSAKLEITLWFFESLTPLILMILLYVIVYYQSGKIDEINLLQLMICAGLFSTVFETLSAKILSLLHILPSLYRVKPLLAETIEDHSHKKRLFAMKGGIKLSHVSLRQDDSDSYLLDDISLEIKPGQFFAIVGPSGAGKSTILKLILGFESPSSGVILLDDENINHLNLSDVRKQIGVVLQTTRILPGTIYSNICANADIPLDEAWRLAKLVGLDEQILAMPMKMQTYLSDNADESLSGGQKQKILIARALATQPKILLLDEATSALDNASQAIVYQNLKELNITRIVIAHRESTIIGADMIYTLDKGKLIALSS